MQKTTLTRATLEGLSKANLIETFFALGLELDAEQVRDIMNRHEDELVHEHEKKFLKLIEEIDDVAPYFKDRHLPNLMSIKQKLLSGLQAFSLPRRTP